MQVDYFKNPFKNLLNQFYQSKKKIEKKTRKEECKSNTVWLSITFEVGGDILKVDGSGG